MSTQADSKVGSAVSLGGSAVLLFAFFQMSYAAALFITMTGAQLAAEGLRLLWIVPVAAVASLAFGLLGVASRRPGQSGRLGAAQAAFGAVSALVLIAALIDAGELRGFIANGFWVSLVAAVTVGLAGIYGYRTSR